MITKEDYYKLTKKFNPGNMENIVLQIKNSGAKYITLTTKHHDGFRLFDACGNGEFDVMHSSSGRDLVKEFVTYERGNARPINRYAMDKYISGEVCDSINMCWGIVDDINYKSPPLKTLYFKGVKRAVENICLQIKSHIACGVYCKYTDRVGIRL